MKNYYQILNLSRLASEEQVRKAFRSMAFSCHPDVSPGGDAKKFMEIREAYDTLIEPGRRSVYDSSLKIFESHLYASQQRKRGDYAPRNTRPTQQTPKTFFQARPILSSQINLSPLNLVTTLSMSMEESIKPSSITVQLYGEENPNMVISSGVIQFPGKMWQGSVLLVEGMGSLDLLTGRRGDLEVNVQIEKHDTFKVFGNNVYLDMNISPWQVALGDSIDFPTLEGWETMRIPTESYSTIRLRGRGLYNSIGQRGDFWIRARLDVGRPPSARARRLWAELAREYSR